MSYQTIVPIGLDYQEYRFGRSRQLFRGPKPDLNQPYCAFIGGAETYGKYASAPFPQQLEDRLQYSCANWGTPGAGPGFFLKDPVVLEACSNARVCVISVMSAHSMSNRLFSVFVRRNERLQSVSDMLRALYPEASFEDFKFVGNMLVALHKISPERFKVVEVELQQAWIARMRDLMRDIETRKVLFWFSDTSPDMAGLMSPDAARNRLPSFVTRAMVDEVKQYCDIYVEYVADVVAAEGPRATNPTKPDAPRKFPSEVMHREAAKLLQKPLTQLLGIFPRAG